MPASISRRHHFLPQFYLKQWFDDSSQPDARAPGVWKILRNGTSARRYSPGSRVFWIENANTLTRRDGELTDLPERILGRIEQVVAEALRGRIATHDALDRDQVDAINMFLASMLIRVPSARSSMQSGFDALARIERETAQANGQPEPNTSLFQRNALAHATMDAVFAVLPELERMCHKVLMAPEGAAFITCDRPVQIWVPVGFAGIANRFCEITLPLSPTRMLYLTWSPLELSGYCAVSTEEVVQMNRRTVLGCHEWIISNTRQTDPRWFEA